MWSLPGSYENRGSGTQQASSDVVPVVGLEPTRHRWQRILSPPRLPFQHTGMREVLYNKRGKISSAKIAKCRKLRENVLILPEPFLTQDLSAASASSGPA